VCAPLHPGSPRVDRPGQGRGGEVEVEEKKGRWAEPGPRWSEVEVEEHERRWRRPGWGGVREVFF
jgi:hypothetical protein